MRATLWCRVSGCVYFIQAGPAGPIKIGFTSRDPYARMAALQTGCHEKLRMVTYLPGSPDDESFFHYLLQHQRLRGEWFRDTPQLRNALLMEILGAEDYPAMVNLDLGDAQ